MDALLVLAILILVVPLAAPSAEQRTPSGSAAAAPRGLIAFESYDDASQILTMRPDGTGLRVLLRNARSPVWSPDGRWLAFIRGGTAIPYVARVRSNGSGLRRVSRFARINGFLPIPDKPAWSPDGGRLAFLADYIVDFDDEGDEITEVGVFIARRDGSRPRRLRRKTGSAGPAWSPDGRRIALMTADGNVGLVSSRGGALRVLRRLSNARSRMEFSPNGRRLLVIVGWGQRSTINLLDVQTGRRTKLPRDQDEWLKFATWTPDGTRIAYMVDVGRTENGAPPPNAPTVLFTIRSDGTGKRRLATVPTYVQGETLTWKAGAR